MPEFAWYVINTFVSNESKVAESIRLESKAASVDGLIGDVLVPSELRGSSEAKKKPGSRVLPGYIFVKMVLNDVTIDFLKGIKGVSKVLGGGGLPTSVPDEQIDLLVDNVSKEVSTSHDFCNVGDVIQITSGPFEGFSAVVDNVVESVLFVSVSIFGRDVEVELSPKDVKRIEG